MLCVRRWRRRVLHPRGHGLVGGLPPRCLTRTRRRPHTRRRHTLPCLCLSFSVLHPPPSVCRPLTNPCRVPCAVRLYPPSSPHALPPHSPAVRPPAVLVKLVTLSCRWGRRRRVVVVVVGSSGVVCAAPRRCRNVREREREGGCVLCVRRRQRRVFHPPGAWLWRYTHIFPLSRVRVVVPGFDVRDVVAHTARE